MSTLRPKDIIQFDKGFPVMCPEIPAYYFKANHPLDERPALGRLNIGEPKSAASSVKALRDEITALIKFSFAYTKTPVDSGILERFINHQVPDINREPFIIPPGLYIVTSVSDGGLNSNVYCETYQPVGRVYKFYFTGGFGGYGLARVVEG